MGSRPSPSGAVALTIFLSLIAVAAGRRRPPTDSNPPCGAVLVAENSTAAVRYACANSFKLERGETWGDVFDAGTDIAEVNPDVMALTINTGAKQQGDSTVIQITVTARLSSGGSKVVLRRRVRIPASTGVYQTTAALPKPTARSTATLETLEITVKCVSPRSAGPCSFSPSMSLNLPTTTCTPTGPLVRAWQNYFAARLTDLRNAANSGTAYAYDLATGQNVTYDQALAQPGKSVIVVGEPGVSQQATTGLKPVDWSDKTKFVAREIAKIGGVLHDGSCQWDAVTAWTCPSCFSGITGLRSYITNDTECPGVSNDAVFIGVSTKLNAVVVVVRGTAGQFSLWLANLLTLVSNSYEVLMAPAPNNNVAVGGVNTAWSCGARVLGGVAYTTLKEAFAANPNLPTTVYVGGHSRGGAISTAIAAFLANSDLVGQGGKITKLGLYALASPRAGNLALAQMVQNKIAERFRIVERFDPVPRAPGFSDLTGAVHFDPMVVYTRATISWLDGLFTTCVTDPADAQYVTGSGPVDCSLTLVCLALDQGGAGNPACTYYQNNNSTTATFIYDHQWYLDVNMDTVQCQPGRYPPNPAP